MPFVRVDAFEDEDCLIRVIPAVSVVDWSVLVMLAVLVKLSVASRLLPRLVRRSLSMTRMLWVPFTRSGGTF